MIVRNKLLAELNIFFHVTYLKISVSPSVVVVVVFTLFYSSN